MLFVRSIFISFIIIIIIIIGYSFYRWTAIAQMVSRLAAGWKARRSNPGLDEIFYPWPNRRWDPPILHNGPGVKRPGRGVDNLHLAPRLKKVQSSTSTPPLFLRGLS
jgi:hypothetical protein